MEAERWKRVDDLLQSALRVPAGQQAGCPRFAPWGWALTWDHRHRPLPSLVSFHAARTETLPTDRTLPFRHLQLLPQAAELRCG